MDYYNDCRKRTYACYFSLENSDYIWENYANESEKSKVCIVFDYSKLYEKLNQTLQPGNAELEYKGNRWQQIFWLNYGIVEYIECVRHQANKAQLLNPIKYTYLKDKKFSKEKELRVSLSAQGMGQFTFSNGSKLDFPPSLQAVFDFRTAIVDGIIPQILNSPDCDSGFLHDELKKLQIVPSKGSDPSNQPKRIKE